MLPDYKVYATLLDSFGWYKRSEAADAKQEFLDKVNRVPFAETDAILRGKAFEKAVDFAAEMGGPTAPVRVHDLEVEPWLIRRFADGFEHAARQVYVETILPTVHGNVLVYGKIDELLGDTAYDTKTTKSYEFPKFLHHWQHPVYLEALKAEGAVVRRFVYRITDFKDVYEEAYHYRSEDRDRLVSELAKLVEFLEIHRPLITDKKVFALV